MMKTPLVPILERAIAFDADPERVADEVLAALALHEKVADLRLALAGERGMRHQQLSYGGWVVQVRKASEATDAAIDALLMPYTAPDKEMARQPSPAPRPDHKRSESRGHTAE